MCVCVCVCVCVSRYVVRCMLQICVYFQTGRKQSRTLPEMAHQVPRMRVYARVMVRRSLYVPILHSTTKKSTKGTGPDAAAGRLEKVREDRRGVREGWYQDPSRLGDVCLRGCTPDSCFVIDPEMQACQRMRQGITCSHSLLGTSFRYMLKAVMCTLDQLDFESSKIEDSTR